MPESQEPLEPSPVRMPPHSSARHAVFWVVVAAAGVVVVLSAIETFVADYRSGEGWVGGPIEAVLAGGPLVLVAVGLRSRRRNIARRTAVASLLFALVVTFVLVMQVLDPNETNGDRLLQGFAVLVYLAAFSVELPAFSRRWPPSGRPLPR